MRRIGRRTDDRNAGVGQSLAQGAPGKPVSVGYEHTRTESGTRTHFPSCRARRVWGGLRGRHLDNFCL